MRIVKPITAMMTPVESVKLFGIKFSMDAARALHSIQKLEPVFFLPTGLEPSRATGLFGKLLVKCQGTIDDSRELLATSTLDTQQVSQASGEELRL